MSNTGTHIQLLPPPLSSPTTYSLPQHSLIDSLCHDLRTRGHHRAPAWKQIAPCVIYCLLITAPSPYLCHSLLHSSLLQPRLVTPPVAPLHHSSPSTSSPWLLPLNQPLEGLQDRTTAPGIASVTPEAALNLTPSSSGTVDGDPCSGRCGSMLLFAHLLFPLQQNGRDRGHQNHLSLLSRQFLLAGSQLDPAEVMKPLEKGSLAFSLGQGGDGDSCQAQVP